VFLPTLRPETNTRQGVIKVYYNWIVWKSRLNPLRLQEIVALNGFDLVLARNLQHMNCQLFTESFIFTVEAGNSQ
jgi:hypothetical protein